MRACLSIMAMHPLMLFFIEQCSRKTFSLSGRAGFPTTRRTRPQLWAAPKTIGSTGLLVPYERWPPILFFSKPGEHEPPSDDHLDLWVGFLLDARTPAGPSSNRSSGRGRRGNNNSNNRWKHENIKKRGGGGAIVVSKPLVAI